MTAESFNKELEFGGGRVGTKVMIETSFSKEIRFLLNKVQIMKEHKRLSNYNHILEGEILLGVKGRSHITKSGQIISLEGNLLKILL